MSILPNNIEENYKSEDIKLLTEFFSILVEIDKNLC